MALTKVDHEIWQKYLNKRDGTTRTSIKVVDQTQTKLESLKQGKRRVAHIDLNGEAKSHIYHQGTGIVDEQKKELCNLTLANSNFKSNLGYAKQAKTYH